MVKGKYMNIGCINTEITLLVVLVIPEEIFQHSSRYEIGTETKA
jgi:hypothetical protein